MSFINKTSKTVKINLIIINNVWSQCLDERKVLQENLYT